MEWVAQPAPVFLPRESHGQRSLVSYSPWGQRVRYDSVTNTHPQNLKVWLHLDTLSLKRSW